MFLVYNAQKFWPAKLVGKASGSFSPRIYGDPNLGTTALKLMAMPTRGSCSSWGQGIVDGVPPPPQKSPVWRSPRVDHYSKSQSKYSPATVVAAWKRKPSPLLMTTFCPSLPPSTFWAGVEKRWQNFSSPYIRPRESCASADLNRCVTLALQLQEFQWTVLEPICPWNQHAVRFHDMTFLG